MRTTVPLGFATKSKDLLARAGLRIQRLSPEERTLRAGFDPRHPPPEQDLDYLVVDNSRLRELEGRYARHVSPVRPQGLWAEAAPSRPEDLRFFRGDNLYLWQYTRSPLVNRYRAYVRARDVQAIDARGLLELLSEDGAFGCLTYDVEGLPLLSRDLLDSVAELAFLDRHTDVLSRPGQQIVDIGAGYGRLAHRALCAAPGLLRYWCIDAVPRSTFLCEYYLRHRGLADRGRVIDLPDMKSALQPGQVDVAVNVHSFSEMPREAVAGWLQWLADLEVSALMVVPNEGGQVLSRESDGLRIDCGPLLLEHGYELVASEPTVADPIARDLLDIHDRFLLYRR